MSQATGFQIRKVDAHKVRDWLRDGGEIAFVDVSEEGQFGFGHPLLAVNVPYSRLEIEIGSRVPRRSVRLVLIGHDAAIVDRAAERLAAIGYTDVQVVEAGIKAWEAAGLQLFEGVNVPSKAFAEIVERELGTPAISAAELKRLQDQRADLVLLDSRTAEEFDRFHVPGARNCPGGELAYRIDDFVQRPETLVVVSCAGRTRGIMGAQSLINAGIPNRVVALAGGTQGWRLAGLQLESGGTEPLARPSETALAAARRRAAALAVRHGVKRIDHATLAAWQAESSRRTTYIFDVRSPAEYQAGHLPGSIPAAGGQLLQTTDHWIGTRCARIVLVDDTGVRALVTAHWLQQLGWDVSVLENALSGQRLETGSPRSLTDLPTSTEIAAEQAVEWLGRDGKIITTGASAAYREAHAAGSIWASRATLDRLPLETLAAPRLLVVAEDVAQAHLVSLDLAQWSRAEVRVLAGGQRGWIAAGLPVESSPSNPPDADRVDFLFWNHDRHQGNAAAMRAYLQWEQDLPAQIARDGTLDLAIVKSARPAGRPAAQ